MAPKIKALGRRDNPAATPLTMGGSRWTLVMTPIEGLNTHFSFPDYCIQLTLFDGLTTRDNQDVTWGNFFQLEKKGKNFRLNATWNFYLTLISHLAVKSTMMSKYLLCCPNYSQITIHKWASLYSIYYLKRFAKIYGWLQVTICINYLIRI